MKWTDNEKISQAMIYLLDNLCMWERETGRNSTLIFIPHNHGERTITALGGKHINSDIGFDRILELALRARNNSSKQSMINGVPVRQAKLVTHDMVDFMECEHCGMMFAVNAVHEETDMKGHYRVWCITGAKYCPFCGGKVRWSYNSSSTTKKEEQKDV